jgi:hypothetical protein
MGVFEQSEKSIFAGNGPLDSEHLVIMNTFELVPIVPVLGRFYCICLDNNIFSTNTNNQLDISRYGNVLYVGGTNHYLQQSTVNFVDYSLPYCGPGNQIGN